MTEEQIKNLKRGDKFIVEYEVTCNEGTFIGVGITHQGKRWTDKMGVLGNPLKTATLVTPPPSFEVGDTVRIVRDPITKIVHGVHGCCWTSDEGCIGTIETITPTECIARIDCLTKHGHAHCSISLHCLEIVKKAVKDKFIIEDAGCDWRIILNENKCGFVAAWDKRNYPNAKEAAEAECARLNAEWRKQQEQKGE